jgi:hypothetical protein
MRRTIGFLLGPDDSDGGIGTDSAMSVVLTTYLSLLDRVFRRDQKPPKHDPAPVQPGHRMPYSCMESSLDPCDRGHSWTKLRDANVPDPLPPCFTRAASSNATKCETKAGSNAAPVGQMFKSIP